MATPAASSTRPTTIKDYWSRYFIQRPWAEFVDTTGFKVPDGATWVERFNDNLVWYFANYLIAFIATTLVIGLLFQQKGFVIAFLIMVGLAAGLFVIHPDPIHVPNSGIVLADLHKLGIFGFVAFFILWLTENTYTLLYCTLFFSLLMVAHASFRQRSGLRPVKNLADSAKYHIEKIGQDVDKLNKAD